MMEALIALGIVGTFSAVAGLLTFKISEEIVRRAELEEEDYVYDNEGNKIRFNEDDQE